ncbi:MAG TPA: hypothetical protein VNI01_00150, partial [Elusimicrobiota bacterium]|nr:hypothetical protein [Elusimicrobiota bacterium]
MRSVEDALGIEPGKPAAAIPEARLDGLFEAGASRGAETDALGTLAPAARPGGLAPAGSPAGAEPGSARLHGLASLGAIGASSSSAPLWLALATAAAVLAHAVWTVLRSEPPNKETRRSYRDKLDEAALLRMFANPRAGAPTLAAAGRMSPDRARSLAAELEAEARELAARHPDLWMPRFAGVVRAAAAPFARLRRPSEPGLGDPHWARIAPDVRREIEVLRGLKGRAARRDYLRA